MKPSELHTKLLKLKHLGKSPSAEFINAAKHEIRAELRDYHARIPDLNGYRRHGELDERGRLRDPSKAKNVVFYSFLNNSEKLFLNCYGKSCLISENVMNIVRAHTL